MTIFHSLPSLVRAAPKPKLSKDCQAAQAAAAHSVASETSVEPATPPPSRSLPDPRITFGSQTIDALTSDGYLSAGGMTLLVTENRCNSTVLALHFLLGEIGNANMKQQAKSGSQPPCLPRSVLYVALDNDLVGVLHDIWRYPVLRASVFPNEKAKDSIAVHWDKIALALRCHEQINHRPGTHLLYRIAVTHPVLNEDCPVGGGGIYRTHLYILVPDLVWCTPEEVIESLRSLLDSARHAKGDREPEECKECLRIDRMVLNRVSRIPANWPMIQNPTLLVSNLARLCAANDIDLMVIDDTATQSETTGHIESRWQNSARNIIRLRRVPLHGTEVVGMELIRATGVYVKALRPMELRAHSTPVPPGQHKEAISEFKLVASDTFRGYTGIFSGKPQRCRTTVDITYDVKDSPLHRDALNMKRNLEGIMDNITVNVLGPKERPGVNSALSNLADVSHDSCHVVSIDEIWLHRLMRGINSIPGLVAFSKDELKAILPEHIRNELTKGAVGGWSIQDVGKYYVSQALTIATRKARGPQAAAEPSPFCAIPFRHNWGVLAVSEFEPDMLAGFLKDDSEDHLEDDGVFKFLRNPRKEPLPTWEKLITFKADHWKGWDKGTLRFFDFQRNTADSVVTFFLELLLNCAGIEEVFCPARWCLSETEVKEDSEGLLFFNTRNWTSVTTASDCKKTRPREESQTISGKFRYALTLMYHLLDDDQRREVALGESLYNEEDYAVRVEGETGRFLRVKTPEMRERPPLSPALLSREWVTTAPRGGVIQERDNRNDSSKATSNSRQATENGSNADSESDATKQNDLNRHIVLKKLPVSTLAGDENLVDAILALCGTPKDGMNEQFKTGLRDVLTGCLGEGNLKSCGVTISGTWYLGTMSGGNRELATDIIRELVSEYHEMDRFFAGSGAPVSQRFYLEDAYRQTEEERHSGKPGTGRDSSLPPIDEHAISAEAEGLWTSKLPYGDVLRSLATEERTKDAFLNTKIIFPFSRARIRNYTMVALAIYMLIRKTMRLDKNKVPAVQSIGNGEKTILDVLVEAALDRIDDIHGKSLVPPEGVS